MSLRAMATFGSVVDQGLRREVTPPANRKPMNPLTYIVSWIHQQPCTPVR